MSSGVSTRAARILAVLAMLVLSSLVAAPAAQAGGPTSALLVSPSTGRTASLYYDDAAYERLSTALGGYSPSANPTIDSENLTAPTSPGSASITVTWLIHDVSVWRIDRIFFTGADGPLIVTQMSADGGDLSAGMYPGETGDDTAVWHRPPDPQELHAVLTTLGLLGAVQPQVVVDEVAGAAVAEVGSETAASPVVVDPADRAGTPWWWALGGLVAGIFLTAAAVRLVPAVRRQLTSRTDDDGPVRMVEVAG